MLIPTLTVREDLGYELSLPGWGWVGEIFGRPLTDRRLDSMLTVAGALHDDYVVAEAVFDAVLEQHGVLPAGTQRADLGPLPGRYDGHPWAVEMADRFAIEVTCKDLLSRIPHEVSVVGEHSGDGDPQRLTTVPFDGWEALDALLRRDPYGEEAKKILGTRVAHQMEYLRRQSADRRGFQGELFWYVGFALPSEAEAARLRQAAEALRKGAPALGQKEPR